MSDSIDNQNESIIKLVETLSVKLNKKIEDKNLINEKRLKNVIWESLLEKVLLKNYQK
jgi:hypothetical protein